MTESAEAAAGTVSVARFGPIANPSLDLQEQRAAHLREPLGKSLADGFLDNEATTPSRLRLLVFGGA